MSIFGIYNIKEKEQCTRIGTIREIAEFLEVTSRQVDKALRENKLLKNTYQIYYLFKE